MGNVPTEDLDRRDWEYLKFSPTLGYQMRYHSSNLFELCFFRQDHLDLYQSVFSTFPDRHKFSSNDLYSEHPTKTNLWKYRGRADDILTLTNGEKVNPIAMENLIGTHPAVRSVLVVGQARFQTALLVEARDPPSCNSFNMKFIEDMWSTIQQANERVICMQGLPKTLFSSPIPTNLSKELGRVPYSEEQPWIYTRQKSKNYMIISKD